MLVLACGGTISSTRSEGGATPTLGAEDLVAGLPNATPGLTIASRTFSTIPSPHMTLDDVLRLHREIVRSIDADASITGVVVTHGTDTLEEVAFALDVLWDRDIPIVITGAMRNPSTVAPDGMANLAAAIATAASDVAIGLGVLVVFNDEIHAARFVRKGHPSNVSAFESPTVGRLGHITEGRPYLLLAPRSRPLLRSMLQGMVPTTAVAPVALLKLTMGDDGRLLRHLLADGYCGLVVEGLGGGHVTPGFIESEALEEILRTIPVVLTTRAGTGVALHTTYDFVGSEIDLLRRGFVPTGILDGPKSRILLSLLLAGGAERTGVVAAFEQYAE